jgi:hypothetical protein
MTLDSQVREKRFDIACIKVLRLAEALGRPGEPKELFDPAYKAGFHADGQVANAGNGADLIQEFHESGSNGL